MPAVHPDNPSSLLGPAYAANGSAVKTKAAVCASWNPVLHQKVSRH